MSTRNRPLSVPVLPAPSLRTRSQPGRAAARVGQRLGQRLRLPLGLALGLGLGLAAGCDESPAPRQELPPPVRPSLAADAAAPRPSPEEAAARLLTELENELVRKHGEAQRARIKRGLKQVAALWRKGDEGPTPPGQDRGDKERGDKDRPDKGRDPGDGDLAAFARAHFISDPAVLRATFQRMEGALEQLDGHLNEIARELRRPADTGTGPLQPVDELLGGIDPAAHLVDDLFESKVAFIALLNFPLTTLAERLESGPSWSRQQWAEARLSGRFARRIPARVQQHITAAVAQGERYIAGYNIWMHHLVDDKGERLFAKGLRLISHWNLRDEIRADYADAQKGLARQRLITQVMERIVSQTIPAAVIDNPRLDWDPVRNTVTPSPPEEIEADAPPPRKEPPAQLTEREPDTRYRLLIEQFRAHTEADPFTPQTPTLIARSFELGRELPEERVVKLLTEVCASPLARQVAALIEKRIGRKLEPHDLWYNGFLPRGRFPEDKLDAIVQKRYPTAAAFEADLPSILTRLGFSKDKARFLAEHVRVDASRGAGHAMQAMRRGDFPRLRTRVEKTGMNYKGYNIAVHELGHNVEQVFSLYGVDHTLLAGVPNNAFTEALAFVFQQRDLELLGLAKPDAESQRLRTLHDFFVTWEIAGVALVEIGVWHYLYDHPDATPAALREETLRLARKTWQDYYAPVLGGGPAGSSASNSDGVALLAVYSHMIQNTLYLPDYPLGHLIAFQIEEHLGKQPPGSLGREFERMATVGSVTPDQWLIQATGKPLSAAPLLTATEAALKAQR
ncbi:MAG: hypothetical protein U1A78_12860 [Polyangia bacterium]